MSDDLKTLANWAKEIDVSEKKLKDAVKAAGLAADSKKGACSFYTRSTVDKVLAQADR